MCKSSILIDIVSRHKPKSARSAITTTVTLENYKLSNMPPECGVLWEGKRCRALKNAVVDTHGNCGMPATSI